METCKSFYEKIILFDDLRDEEQQEVKQHTERCPKCREHLKEFQVIMTALKQTNHIDDELLTRYSIYLSDPKRPDYNGRRLAREEISRIKKHVDLCPSCQQKVDLITQEYQEIEEYLQKAGLPSLKLSKSSAWIANISDFFESVTSFWKNLILLPRPKLYPIAVGALAVVLILIWVGPFFRGGGHPYYQLTSLEKDNITFLTRGAISTPISDGLSAFNNGNYQEAIKNFEQFVERYPDDPSLFYVHYVLGIAYLFEAKTDLLGWFPKFDTDYIDKGIQHLQKALSLSDNLRIKEDSYWYMGKAYLMKEEGTKAKETFKKVVELKGRRFTKAQQIIAQIEKIPFSQE